MPNELDPKLAERLASSAIGSLRPPHGGKVLCSKRALHEAFLDVAQEAFEIGFLAGQKEHYGPLTRPGSPDRPPWMDIRLDDGASLAEHKIRFKPVALRSLIGAGYRCLGDLRWVSNRELRQFHYIGIRTAQQIRAVVGRFEGAR
jgi:hypothetical protein